MEPIFVAAGGYPPAERLAVLSSPAVLLSMLALGAVFFAASATARRLDGERIRQAVAQAGGAVIQITYIGLFDERHGRTYEVTYRAARNVIIRATCKTGLAIGVLWVSDTPPMNSTRGECGTFAASAGD